MARRVVFIGILILAFLLVRPLLAPGLDYPPNFQFIKVPDLLSGDNPTYPLIPRSVPVPGQSFYDLRFGTVLTRVTQATNLRHEYSRFDPFNVDHSMIILHVLATGDWQVYKTQPMPYDQSGNLVRTLDIAEPRWDGNDPHMIWGLQDFRIVKINVQTGQKIIVKDFSSDSTMGPIITAEPDLYRITTKDEGEASLDQRFWALALQGVNEDYRLRYIFTWDRQQNKILGLYKLPATEAELIDWVGMSPRGNWVLIGGDADSGRTFAGLNMANKQLTNFHRLAYNTGHSDVGLDSQGKEIIVMQNSLTDYIDLIPIDLNTTPVQSLADYSSSTVMPLVRLFYSGESPIGFNCGVHISCNVSGYCVISTHLEPGVAEQNWLDRTITLVRLNRNKPEVFYLAKVYNTTAAYWEETQATITNDGSKVIWASNWNQNVGQEKCFLMQLDMPKNWRQLPANPHNILLLLSD